MDSAIQEFLLGMGFDQGSITVDAHLRDDLCIDDFSWDELCLAVGLTPSDYNFENTGTILELMALIDQKKQQIQLTPSCYLETTLARSKHLSTRFSIFSSSDEQKWDQFLIEEKATRIYKMAFIDGLYRTEIDSFVVGTGAVRERGIDLRHCFSTLHSSVFGFCVFGVKSSWYAGDSGIHGGAILSVLDCSIAEHSRCTFSPLSYTITLESQLKRTCEQNTLYVVRVKDLDDEHIFRSFKCTMQEHDSGLIVATATAKFADDIALVKAREVGKRKAIGNKIVALISSLSGTTRTQIQLSSSFQELGFDSDLTLKLRREIEKLCEVKTPSTLLDQYQTVGGVLKFFRATYIAKTRSSSFSDIGRTGHIKGVPQRSLSVANLLRAKQKETKSASNE